MNKFVFVKKDIFDNFSDRVRNEFILHSKINKNIPTATINSIVYYCFEFCADITQTNYVKNYPYYCEENAAKIISGELFLDTSEMNLIPDAAPFKSKVLPSGKKLFKRLHGSASLNIPAGETGVLELEVGYTHAKMQSIECLNSAFGDVASLYILDTSTGTYSGVPDSVLNCFGIEVNLCDGVYKYAATYDADLYAGMVIRLEYDNNGLSARTVSFNADLNEVV